MISGALRSIIKSQSLNTITSPSNMRKGEFHDENQSNGDAGIQEFCEAH
ncbi:MAG: hypothetical protein QS99_C0005G0048 [archaeon GW2011_AR4]|nr:MAG: hypothetical protein QS99_C0005G0048 [archaeon GW2011_AR4]